MRLRPRSATHEEAVHITYDERQRLRGVNMSVQFNDPEPAGMVEAQGPDGGIGVALLTGADDKTYALGLASALLEQGISVDFIGSDTVNCRELDSNPLINFL